MSENHHNLEGERLTKRVMALLACSRSEAERLIEGGWVRVDGVIADTPGQRVQQATVEVDRQGLTESLQPVSLIWHKPAGVRLEEGQPMPSTLQPSGLLRPWHVKHLRCLTSMPANSSGLAVFSQIAGVQRKLQEDRLLLEHEWMLEIPNSLNNDRLERLAQGAEALACSPRSPYLKLSVNSQNAERTRLRLAIKAYAPEQLPLWLQRCGVVGYTLHRLRLGRVALGQIKPNDWRLLEHHERF